MKYTNKHGLILYATIEEVKRRCEELRNSNEIIEYAFAEHDKDVKADGSPKEKHIHCYVVLDTKRAEKTVRKMFANLKQSDGTVGNVLISSFKHNGKPLDLEECEDYLTHENDDSKHHYDKSIVQKSATWDEIVSRETNEENPDTDSATDIIESMLNGVSMRELMKKYGRDFIINYSKYREFTYCLKCEEVDAEERKVEAERKTRDELLADILDVSEPLNSVVIRKQEDEIERLKAILRANKIGYQGVKNEILYYK